MKKHNDRERLQVAKFSIALDGVSQSRFTTQHSKTKQRGEHARFQLFVRMQIENTKYS